jgi:hypothetical protein
MKSVWLTGLVLASWLGAAHATDLNVRTLSNGGSLIHVAPGATVTYSLQGELSDGASAGLALFTCDLSFTGGPLIPLGVPSSAPMDNFNTPKGFVNPTGFGGSLIGGNIVQVGGGQNTIKNAVAPTPNGTVIQNVAQFGSPITLASGQVTAPYVCTSYTLTPFNVKANVIRAGQAANPQFWKVDDASNGIESPLTVVVMAVRPDRAVVSPSNSQSVRLNISAGPANAGRQYKMVGSWSGTTPGTPLPGGLTLPLNNDRYLEYTTGFPNSPVLQNSQGTLDANGRVTVIFRPTNRFEGLTVHHAFHLLGPIDFVSEAESVLVVH